MVSRKPVPRIHTRIPVILVCLLWALSCSEKADPPNVWALTPSGNNYGPADFVTSAKYSSIFIEVDAEGKNPQKDPLDLFQAELNRLNKIGAISKPGGVQIVKDEVWQKEGALGATYTLEEIKNLIDKHRSLEPPAGAAGLYLLYLDAQFEGDTDDAYTLGFSLGKSVVVLFRYNVLRAAEEYGVKDKALFITEASLLVHEFGHVMGLVNDGTPMLVDHHDVEHGAHDTDDNCIMHWESDKPKLLMKIKNKIGKSEICIEDKSKCGNKIQIFTFGQNCLDDLKAVAGQ